MECNLCSKKAVVIQNRVLQADVIALLLCSDHKIEADKQIERFNSGETLYSGAWPMMSPSVVKAVWLSDIPEEFQ